MNEGIARSQQIKAPENSARVFRIGAEEITEGLEWSPDARTTVRLDALPTVVIGIVPREFRGLSGQADLWVNLASGGPEVYWRVTRFEAR